MKGTTFAKYIRGLTKTNSTTLTDADIVTYANVVKDDLAASIVANVDENYFDMELIRDLEVGIRDYTYPDDILKQVKYTAAKLDGTNWKYMQEAFISQFDTPMLENSHIKDKYENRDPEFYITGRGLTILSGDDIIAVTGGLKLLAEIYPEDITATSLASTDDLSVPTTNTTHALPRPTHKHWALKVVIEYKQSRDKPIPLTQQEKKVDIDLVGVFSKLIKRNAVRTFVATVPTYNNGQDY